MPDHVTLAHDSIKSGTWTPKSRVDPLKDRLEAIIRELGDRSEGEIVIHAESGEILSRMKSLASDILDADSATEKGTTDRMAEQTDYRQEMKLRDDQLRREMDLRQESFRAEQAIRDKALENRFSSFLAAQSERDKAWEKISDARFDRIEKDVSSIKADTKKVSDDISGIKLTMAKYLGAAIVIGAVASAILGAAAKHLLG